MWGRGAFSFSVKPLRVVRVFGIKFSGLGVLLAVAVVLYRLLSPESFEASTAGWASLAVAVLFFGGLQMIFFGILGEYAGRTFLRVNEKPQTAIRAVIGAANRTKSDATRFRTSGKSPEEEPFRWRRA